MKKKHLLLSTLLIIIVSIPIILILGNSYAVEDEGRFEEDTEGNTYYYKNGEPVSGYQIINNVSYYFNTRNNKLILNPAQITAIEAEGEISYDIFYNSINEDDYYNNKDQAIKDIDVLYMAHDLANWEKYYKKIKNPIVKCGSEKREFLIKGLEKPIVVTTNVNWDNCNKFTINDSELSNTDLRQHVFIVADNLYLKTKLENIQLSDNAISSLNSNFTFGNNKINMSEYSKKLANRINTLVKNDIKDSQQKYFDDISNEINSNSVNKFMIRVVSNATGDCRTAYKRFVRTGSNSCNYDLNKCPGTDYDEETIRQSDKDRNCGSYWEDFFVIDRDGNILSELKGTILDNYGSIDEIYIHPIYADSVTIGGQNEYVEIETITNNKVYSYDENEEKCKRTGWTVYRDIMVLASNVTIKNLKHTLDESQSAPVTTKDKECQGIDSANLYDGIIYSTDNYNFKMENVLLKRHTVTSNKNGTYDLQLWNLIKTTLINVKTTEKAKKSNGQIYEPTINSNMDLNNIENIYSDIIRYEEANQAENLVRGATKWSVVGLNNIKNLVMENCIGVEAGFHTNANNISIINSILSTITTQGYENMAIDNSLVFDLPTSIGYSSMIYLRREYGGSWDGNIMIKNSKFVANNPGKVISSDPDREIIIYSEYDKNNNYGYELHFPSVYIDGLYVDVVNSAKENVYLMAIRDAAGDFCTKDDNNNIIYVNDKDFAKHYVNDNIVLSNININVKGNNESSTLKLFTDKFLNTPCSLTSNVEIERANGFFSQKRYLNGTNQKTNILIDNSVSLATYKVGTEMVAAIPYYQSFLSENQSQFVIRQQELNNNKTITFNGNGSSGVMNVQIVQNIITKINKNIFTRDGYEFVEWNTSSDGSGTSYRNEQYIPIQSNLQLYAIWMKSNPYTINNYLFDKDNNYINRIGVNTTIEELKNNIELNSGYTIDVEYKTIDDRKVIYTGSKTRIYQGNNLYVELTNIVTGDINGDGAVNITDARGISRQIINRDNTLVNEYLLAADYNGDGQIKMNDVMRILNQ